MAGPAYAVHGPIRVQPLDGLTLVFHEPSGQTHFVASPVPEILEALGSNAGTAADLHARLAQRFDLSGGETALADHLSNLDTLGLVRRS